MVCSCNKIIYLHERWKHLFMSLYILEPNHGCAELDLQVLDFEDKLPKEIELAELIRFSMHNLSLKSHWPLMSTGWVVPNEADFIPDVSLWLDYGLLLSPTAKIYLGAMLKPYGEFLPISIADDTWYIFNCLVAVDQNNTQDMESIISFNRSSLGNKPIFKCLTPENFGFYCQSKFKDAVEFYNLKGLKFSLCKSDLEQSQNKKIILVD